MRIDRVELFRLSIPLVEPFRSSTGETFTRELGLLRLTADDGHIGLGEITPYPGGGSNLQDLIFEFERQARGPLLDDESPAQKPLASELPREVAAAINVALLDLRARRQGLRVADLTGGAVREEIPVNATITAQDPEEVAASASAAVAHGFTTIKLKVGFSLEDAGRVAAARKAAGPEVLLRLDANGAWSEEQAIGFISEIAGQGIELVEQPVAAGDLEAMRRVRESAPMPIIADEGIRSLEDLRSHIAARACDGVALKVSQTGGFSAAFELAQLARAAGLSAFVTSTLDGPVGLAAGMHLAAAGSTSGIANGLATNGIFVRTYGFGLPETQSGSVRLSGRPGLGIEIDEDALVELAID